MRTRPSTSMFRRRDDDADLTTAVHLTLTPASEHPDGALWRDVATAQLAVFVDTHLQVLPLNGDTAAIAEVTEWSLEDLTDTYDGPAGQRLHAGAIVISRHVRGWLSWRFVGTERWLGRVNEAEFTAAPGERVTS